MKACPLCGGEASGNAPGLLACQACGLVFREKRAFAEPAYPPDLEAGIYGPAKRGLFAAALDLMERALPGRGRLLDIGCADGELMKMAAARGWEAEGVELSGPLAGRAAAPGFAVHRRPVEEAGLGAGAYDAVAAFEVFSQMARPAAAAAEIFRLLKPGGLLYIREFNAAFHLPLYGLELRGFFKPFGASPSIVHDFNFGARSLGTLLERAGFREVKIRNSRPTSGDPYRTGGALGGFLTAGLKVLYYTLSEALYYLSFGRVLAGSSLIAVARK